MHGRLIACLAPEETLRNLLPRVGDDRRLRKSNAATVKPHYSSGHGAQNSAPTAECSYGKKSFYATLPTRPKRAATAMWMLL